jgi:hypothetical protein
MLAEPWWCMAQKPTVTVASARSGMSASMTSKTVLLNFALTQSMLARVL